LRAAPRRPKQTDHWVADELLGLFALFVFRRVFPSGGPEMYRPNNPRA